MTVRATDPGERKGPLGLDLELVLIIAGIVVMTHATSMLTVPLLPRFVDELGGTVVGVGLAMAVYAAARLLVNIPAGMLSERFGRRRIIIAGVVGVGIFASLAGTSSGIPVFLVYRFLLGVFSAMAITISMVALTDLTTVANRGRTLSIVSGAHLAVGIAAPGIGGLVAEVVGIRVPFYASGVGALLVAAWALVRLPETKFALSAASTAMRSQLGGGSTWGGTRALLGNGNFMLICLVGFAHFSTRAGASHSLIPLFADGVVSLSPGQLGLFFSIASLIHGVLVYPAGVVSDRWGRKVLIVPGGVLAALALVYFPFADGLWTFAVAFIVLHTASGFSGGAPMAYVGDVAPADLRGLSFGAYRTFGDLAGVVAPLGLVLLAQAFSFQWGFFAAAALNAVALVPFAWLAAETAGRRGAARLAQTEAEPAHGP